jgi:hypothetical protein
MPAKDDLDTNMMKGVSSTSKTSAAANNTSQQPWSSSEGGDTDSATPSPDHSITQQQAHDTRSDHHSDQHVCRVLSFVLPLLRLF